MATFPNSLPKFFNEKSRSRFLKKKNKNTKVRFIIHKYVVPSTAFDIQLWKHYKASPDTSDFRKFRRFVI